MASDDPKDPSALYSLDGLLDRKTKQKLLNK